MWVVKIDKFIKWVMSGLVYTCHNMKSRQYEQDLMTRVAVITTPKFFISLICIKLIKKRGGLVTIN